MPGVCSGKAQGMVRVINMPLNEGGEIMLTIQLVIGAMFLLWVGCMSV